MIYKVSTEISKDILDFIAQNKVASVCCSEDNRPYCFNCFYSVLEDEGCIVFKSSIESNHVKILATNNMVAGTVIASDISSTKVEGIQFKGLNIDKDPIAMKAAKSYYKRYPFAVAMPGRLWVLEIHSIKYTNTTNGIKRKLEWERE